MRKPLLAITAALLGCVIAAPTANAAPSTGDAKKACADVVDGRAIYQSVPDATDANRCRSTRSDGPWRLCLQEHPLHDDGSGSETDSTVLATADGVPIRPDR